MNDMLITLEANATDIEEEPTLNQFITAIINEKRETDVFLDAACYAWLKLINDADPLSDTWHLAMVGAALAMHGERVMKPFTFMLTGEDDHTLSWLRDTVKQGTSIQLDISDTDDATVIERCRKAVRWLQAIESNTTAHGSETTLAILSRVRSRLGCL